MGDEVQQLRHFGLEIKGLFGHNSSNNKGKIKRGGPQRHDWIWGRGPVFQGPGV